MSDAEVIEQLRDELDRESSGVAVAAVEIGGRRRLRRARAVQTMSAAAAAASIVGALYVGSTWGGDQAAPSRPAGVTTSGLPGPLSGCTLTPSTCRSTIVQSWGGDRLRQASFGPADQSDPELAALQPPHAYSYSSSVAQTPDQSAWVDIVIAADDADAGLFTGAVRTVPTGEDALTWSPVRTMSVMSGVEARIDSATRLDGRVYELWTVRSDEWHGAVAVAYEGASDPWWSDARAVELIQALLTTP